MTNEEELQERSGVNDRDRPCRHCGHLQNEHVDGTCADNGPSQIGEDGWGNPEYELCGCPHYEPQDASDILSAEHPEEI